MRHLILAAAIVMTAGPALASSIETITGTVANNGSVIALNCAHCPAPHKDEDKSAYKVPALANGTQKTELVDIDGEKKIVRTEAWMGGSPVVYVSKADGWLGVDAGTAVASGEEGVDLTATTAAVVTNTDVEPALARLTGPAGSPAPAGKLDVTGYELRLD